MTREEAMEMTDQDLRIKAAELMGPDARGEKLCFDDPEHVVPCLEGQADVSDCFHLSRGGCWNDCDMAVHGELPDYPNDIAAAWDLFIKMVENENDPTLSVLQIDEKAFQYEVEVWARKPPHSSDMCFARDLSAPRAITRAFILAMGDDFIHHSGCFPVADDTSACHPDCPVRKRAEGRES